MEIDKEIVTSLTYRGVLAYVACGILGDGSWTSAQLAQAVSCNSSLMLEGMHELQSARPEIVGKQRDKKWPVGEGVVSTEVVQILDSKAARRQELLDDLKNAYEWANKGLLFTMGSFDGVAVARFLRKNSKVAREQWRMALYNRYRSDGIVPGQPLHVWLDRLMEYLPGRQDRFGKLMENGVGGKNGEILTTRQRNREGIERAVANA